MRAEKSAAMMTIEIKVLKRQLETCKDVSREVEELESENSWLRDTNDQLQQEHSYWEVNLAAERRDRVGILQYRPGGMLTAGAERNDCWRGCMKLSREPEAPLRLVEEVSKLVKREKGVCLCWRQTKPHNRK